MPLIGRTPVFKLAPIFMAKAMIADVGMIPTWVDRTAKAITIYTAIAAHSPISDTQSFVAP